MPPRGNGFASTRWSVIARSAANGDADAQVAFAEFFTLYRRPLYVYLRRRGLDSSTAEDTLQSFFLELLDRQSLTRVDPAGGRFRAWLMTALDYHLSHERERDRALKRGGTHKRVEFENLDSVGELWLTTRCREMDPAHAYERAWAIELLDRALADLEALTAAEGKRELLEALKPGLIGEEGLPKLREVAQRIGSTEGALKLALFRLRTAYRTLIRKRVRSTLEDPDDVDSELATLLKALA